MNAELARRRVRPRLKGALSRSGALVCWGAAFVAMGLVSAADSQTVPDPTTHNVPFTLWSFRSIDRVSPPSTKNRAWVKNPVDAFVLAKLEQAKLTPAPPANRLALLRRAHFDLTGLPPTPEEIEAFARDGRPAAYAELVERLLSASQYGERWGRHWLDVVRYADTGGFEVDHVYANAWRYRDYVIRSFNADKPFDRFIQEQVAGDELWPDNPESAGATALYAIGPVMQESAMVSNQLEYEWLTDAADTTGAAFLGLTLGCARCHDHKYDPISQKDYFAMQAIFAASERPYPDKIREVRIKALNGLLADMPLPKELEQDPRCTLKTERATGLRLWPAERPLEVRLLRRGELSKPRELVEPALLSALVAGKRNAELAVSPGQRRAALAQWLTRPDENTLTPRVIVNRVWAWHFGEGLVRTPNDFGNQGEPPTHSELLDWLARDFVAHGWSLKHLHRLIMLSSTYQMQSRAPAHAAQADPENRLLTHFPRRRLEAEAIWDHLHSCAGTLNPEQFGPPVVPPLTKDELTGLFNANQKWPVTKDPNQHGRRSVYLFVRRTFAFPLFDAFDSPETMMSCPRRRETTVPAQALALLNGAVAWEQSGAFAARLLKECGESPQRILPRAWLLAFNRPITQGEAKRAMAYLRKREAAIRKSMNARHSLVPVDARPAEPSETVSKTSFEPADKRADLPPDTAPGDPAPRRGLPRSALEAALTELCLALVNANEFVYLD